MSTDTNTTTTTTTPTSSSSSTAVDDGQQQDPQGQQSTADGDGLSEAGKRALAAERKAARDATKRADELAAKLQQLEDRDKTEAEKLAARAAESDRALIEERAARLRLDVAFAKGLTPAQAKRLVGTTREDLEADADEVLREFPTKPGRPAGDIGQGARTPTAPVDPRAADIAQIEADITAGRRR